MRRWAARFFGFMTSFLLTSFWHLRWTVPAWILLGLHIWLKISGWWATGCFLIFFSIMLLRCLLLNSLVSVGSYTDEKKPNVNPYSAKLSDILPEKSKKSKCDKTDGEADG